MGISIQRRRGTTAQHVTFTGKPGEVTVDTTLWTLRVHDGSTAGGFALAQATHTHPDATESTDGFMSAADKVKLDSISGGAINYQVVQANGTSQSERQSLNFAANFALTDDSAGNRTSVDLSDSGVGAGTYTKVTVNAKGRVTGGALLSAGDIPNITSSKISDLSTTVQAFRLDQFAAPSADVNFNSKKITNLADPVSSTDAATKQYVDSTATGLTFKAACRAASTSNVNINAPGTSIDTVSLNIGDRVLLKNQSDATQNGIYVFNGASSPLTRALDANTAIEIKPGMFVLVTEGVTNSDIGFVLSTTGTITLGTTNLTFVPFSSAGSAVGGNGISVVGNTVSVVTANSGRVVVGPGGVDLATTAVTPGSSYNTFTVDAYGRVTAASSTSYQPLNSNLSAVAGIGINGFLSRTGSGTFAARAIQGGTGITITNGDGVSGNVSIAVTPQSTVQQINVAQSGTINSTRPTLNLIPGAGITLTEVDNPSTNSADVTIGVSGGGGGAPLTAQYLVLANDTYLTNERALVVTSPLTVVDGGANSNYTLGFATDWGSVP